MSSKVDFSSKMTSLDAMEQVDFNHYWLIAQRRWKPTLGIFATTLLLSGLGAALQKSSYSANGKVLIKSNTLPSLTGLGGELTGRVSNLSMQSNPVRTEMETLTSRPILQRTIDALKLVEDDGKPVRPEDLAKKVKVKDAAGADVLKLTYSSKSAEQASAVINQILQEYTQVNLQENRSEAIAAREFISSQLPKTEANVRQADSALRRFKERNRVSDLKGEQELLNSVLGQLEREIVEAKDTASELTARFTNLRNRLRLSPQQAVDAASLSQSPNIQETMAKLQQVQTQLRLERTRFTEQHPAIQDLREKESELQSLLQERVAGTAGSRSLSDQDFAPGEIRQGLMKDYVDADVQRNSVVGRLNSLILSRDGYRDRLLKIPRLEQEQRQLQRNLEAAQSTYESLLKKLREVELAEKQNVGTARIIEQAVVPDKPNTRQRLLTLLLGGVAGTALALGLLIALELRDKSVKTVKEARDLFGYPWLGTIPFHGRFTPSQAKLEWSVPELPVRDDPRSGVSAAYRMLQANLKFLSLDEKLKSMVITSAVPREGKSAVAANLAATMAQLGRRTLLIDADMHHPSQHHIWRLLNADGLSHALVEQSRLQDAIVPVLDNLDVLPCGVIPPHPLSLLDSKRMATLLQTFEQQYDFVILDAPPLVIEAEALTLGKLSGGILLVARPGVVDYTTAMMAKELLEQSAQTVLGMVLNATSVDELESQRAYYSEDFHARSAILAR